MSFVKNAFFLYLILLFSGVCLLEDVLATDEFSFDIEEIEKKSLTWGGFAELRWDHMDINQGSSLSVLNLAEDPRSTIDLLYGGLKLDGNYSSQEWFSISWLLKFAGQQDSIGWSDTADIFSAYISLKPTPAATINLGKKNYKWGKGYAWNPAGFINRRKDPNNPDESLEGYVVAEADFIQSFAGALQTVALNMVLLPVYDGINENFGEEDKLNLAAKLYFLLFDTDIDLLLFAGDSRANSYGFDFSKNLATNFEIHGELAWSHDQKKFTLQNDNSLLLSHQDVLSYLIGVRYLSESDVTSIVEYYHNDGGYTEDEMSRFFQLIQDAGKDFQETASRVLLDRARDISLKGYGRPQSGRNYLYARFSQKEPFDILYFTPALTTIFNIDDQSYTLTPELIYTGFTNWELRLRFSYLNGAMYSEYGEKQNSNKSELRLRYYF